jgi:hypothetical protein
MRCTFSLCLGNDLAKDDDTYVKNSVDGRDFWIVFYEVYSAWGMVSPKTTIQKKLNRSQRFLDCLFYEVYIFSLCLGNDLAKNDDTKKTLDRRDFWIVFYEVYILFLPGE